MQSPGDIKTALRELALRAGYAECGFCTPAPFDDFAGEIEQRCRRFPETAAAYAGMRARARPADGAPWARSVMVCLRHYGKYRLWPALEGHIGRNYLFDRRTPACPDHDMPARLKAGLRALGVRFRRGGLPDRAAAARAGVARIARNGFAYSDRHGSWINIECWLLDAEVAPDAPAPDTPCPPGCRRCLDACPTAALAEPYVMRMSRCVAYLTYHAPFPVEAGLWKRMGTWIYGCDICQLVCPLNRDKWRQQSDAVWLAAVAGHLTPAALAEMDAETYRRVVHPLFWYIPPDDPQRWRDNARRALESEKS